MRDPDARASGRTLRIAVVVLATVALALLLPLGIAAGLTPLPDYLSYIEDGGVWAKLPSGQDAVPYVAPEAIPAGADGLEPPAEVVAFRWASDGTSMALLARSTKTLEYREFSFDRQAKTVKTAAGASSERPKTYADGTPVDVSEAPAKAPFGGATARLMRNGDPSVMQVFVEYPGKGPIIVSAPEVRDRDCSHLSYSASGNYLAYQVRWSKSRNDVWASTSDGRYSWQVATEAVLPAFVPPYRPGGTGGPGATSGGGPGCPALSLLFGLTAIGAGAVAFVRGIVP